MYDKMDIQQYCDSSCFICGCLDIIGKMLIMGFLLKVIGLVGLGILEIVSVVWRMICCVKISGSWDIKY